LVRGGAAAVTGSGDPEQATTLLVTAGAMRAFGVRPALGRELSNDDDLLGAVQTTILSDRYWQQRFGGDPSVVGRTIAVDGTPREVIGVMPRGFNFRDNPADLILPLQLDLAQPRADFSYATVARLKPGVTVADANLDLGRILPIYIDKYMRPIPAANPDALQMQPAVRPLKEDVVGNIGEVLWVLLGSISILLLIACANVANLLLVRTETRGTELAVRTALGAGTGHLARALMTESLTLGIIGGLVGVALAYGALQVLVANPPAYLPRLDEITIDLPVLGFAVAMSILSGLLFGLFPIVRLAGRRFAGNIAEFVQGGGRGASAGRKQQRSQNALVVVQVALALVMRSRRVSSRSPNQARFTGSPSDFRHTATGRARLRMAGDVEPAQRGHGVGKPRPGDVEYRRGRSREAHTHWRRRAVPRRDRRGRGRLRRRRPSAGTCKRLLAGAPAR
jgi:predicted permease